MNGPKGLPRRPGIPPSHEQRRWGRFLADVGELVIRIGDDDYRRVTVLDESFGGIGLSLDGLLPVKIGEEVAINYEGANMSGIVQYAVSMQDGQQRVGIEWLPAPLASSLQHASVAQIEGRLLALFRLLESGGWSELARAAQQLSREAEALGFEELVHRAHALIRTVEDRHDKQTVLRDLEALVDACTAVAG